MRVVSMIALAALVSASPMLAQKAKDPAPAKAVDPDKPMTEKDVSAGDVATTPLGDLNLKKGEIPPQLVAAQDRPYDLSGMTRCANLAAAVGELDAILGEDLDITAGTGETSAGKVAQSVVGAFIPFRGVIREVSGANSSDRKLQLAIRAGVARRSFLKGVGLQRGCLYPARPASPQIVAAKLAEIAAADPKDKDKQAAAAKAAEEAKAARPVRKKRGRKR